MGQPNSSLKNVSSKCKIYQTVIYGYKLKITRDREYLSALHSREEFLSKSSNKQHLIKVLAKHCRGDGHTAIEWKVIECTDTEIVATALDNSYFKQRVNVKTDDTDILALLFYFWNSEMGDIIL